MNLDYKPKNNQSIFPTTEEQTIDLAVDKKRKLVFLTEKEQLLKSGQSTLLSEQAAIIKPIEIQNNKPIDVKVVKSHHSVSAFDLNRLILNPHAEGLNLLKSLVEVDRYYLEKATKDLESNFVEKESVSKQQLATFVNEGSSEYRKTGDLVNIVISREVITRHLPEKAIFYGVKRLLILTDVDSQQTSKYYRLMLKTLAQYGVETLEFTNIQPYFNVATLNEVANFGLNHAIDGILAFGS